MGEGGGVSERKKIHNYNYYTSVNADFERFFMHVICIVWYVLL